MSEHQISETFKEEQLRKLQNFNVAVYHSKNALMIAAGVLLASVVVGYAFAHEMPKTVDLLLFTVVFISFLALSFWTQKKPYAALRLAVVIYLFYILINMLPFISTYGVEGILKGLYSGCLYKIIIITVIAKATPKAKAMQSLHDEIING
ncbi:hypothetical protein BH11BAC3_BH11BAC3_25810 [soil metagenome]